MVATTADNGSNRGLSVTSTTCAGRPSGAVGRGCFLPAGQCRDHGSRGSLRLDAGRPDHLDPLLGFVPDELAEVGGGKTGLLASRGIDHMTAEKQYFARRTALGSGHLHGIVDLQFLHFPRFCVGRISGTLAASRHTKGETDFIEDGVSWAEFSFVIGAMTTAMQPDDCMIACSNGFRANRYFSTWMPLNPA
jgi:hypothetical protein